MRDSSLQRICTELMQIGIKMNIKDIKNKIKNLRATYCQELSKIEKSTRSGAGAKDEYKPKMNWFEEMHSFIKNVPMKRKTTDSQESETIDEEPDNRGTDIENSEDNIDVNIDNSEDVADSENLLARPSTSSSTSSNITKHKTSEVSAAPTPKRKRFAQVTSLVKEIRSIKEDLKSIPDEHNIIHNIPEENEHDIFGKFVASQLKQLSIRQAILARDEINATLSRGRLQDLNNGNTTFSFQTLCDNSSASDSTTTIYTVPVPLPSNDSICSTIEYQKNSHQQNENEINFDSLRNENNDGNIIVTAFRDG
ncbi:uncharacterized protein LOC111691681 [Anoplophora glabripennis]|uniref:uncharacterized protein LOC111691681 n=1 Tax=Anoplophora glabripennis TaxID=217634 RepID=UPI000C760B07|nr:uncharacterized protein LOC111691681 [Anoplophora glabripennis]